jgi:hypothetical protein
VATGGARKDLADPIGDHRDRGAVRELREPFSMPAGEVGFGDVGQVPEVQFRFGEDDPITWANETVG